MPEVRVCDFQAEERQSYNLKHQNVYTIFNGYDNGKTFENI